MNSKDSKTFQGVPLDPAVARSRKHALWSMGSFLGLGFIWVLVTIPLAYLNDPLDFPMVLGLPLWAFIVLFGGGTTAFIVQMIFAYVVFPRAGDDL